MTKCCFSDIINSSIYRHGLLEVLKMEFLKWLQSIRNPVLDWFMSTVTHFGAETLFIVVALVIYWCVDKKRGYYLLFTGFTGIVSIQILKMAFRIPRPWVLDPDFTIVESARAEATGYSFPSGHTQCATTLYGAISRSSKRRAVQVGGIVLCLLVAISRMYLGVHTPLDVLVSLGIGAILVLLFYPIMQKANSDPRFMYGLIGATLLLSLGNLLFVELYRFPADVDAVNLQDAKEVAWKMLFMMTGMLAIYPLDRHLIKFETKAVWWAQLLKLAGGVTVVMAIRILLKAPLNALFGACIGGGIRYLFVVLAAGLLWPLTFGFFSKLGKLKEIK